MQLLEGTNLSGAFILIQRSIDERTAKKLVVARSCTSMIQSLSASLHRFHRCSTDDDYNLFDDELTARAPKESISLSDNITNHMGTQKYM